MRRVLAVLGLITLFVTGAAIGSAPAAPTSSQVNNATQPTNTSPTTTTTATPTTTTPSTTTSTTTTTTSTTTPPPPAIPQPSGSPLNNNTIENRTDGTTIARSKLQAAHANDSQADPVNFAYAYAHDCANGCKAIAAAFQVALIDNGARVQTPQNVALAVNYHCHNCGVFAYAYQYAVEVPKGTHLTPGTRHTIAMIREQADDYVQGNLTFPELDSKLKALAAQLRAAVDNGLQAERVHEGAKHSHEHEQQTGQG